MPIEFPDWSDLGLGALSAKIRHAWDYELMLMETYRRYFDGEVFEERVQTEIPNDAEAPLLFPVGINLVKMLCIAQADSAFGEWDEQPVMFGVRQDQEITDSDKRAIEIAQNILEASNAGALLWEHELDRNVFGGGAIRIAPDLTHPAHIRWSRIPRDCFFPIWNPDDPDDLLEVYVVTYMTADQAEKRYRITPKRDIVQRVERWDRKTYESRLDGVRLNDYSGVNPWGIAPFVYTPRLRFHAWWGEPLTPDILRVQDQLNMTVGDIAEAINYNAHPVRWGLNLPREFNARNFPLGPNAMWNLGRSIGNSPEPKVGLLEASAAVAPGVFEFTKFVYDWSRTSSSAPPIAFGEDNGGGQRSGVTLEIRMWPLIKAIRRSRSYLTASLNRALYISGLMLDQKRFSDIPARGVQSLLNRRIVPHFAEILPRDQQAIVDEVVKLSATTPPAISLETAQVILGRGTGEVERIKEQLKDKELYAREDAQMQQEKDLAEKSMEAKAKAPTQKPARPND